MRGTSAIVSAVIFFSGMIFLNMRLISGTLLCQLFTRSAWYIFGSQAAVLYGNLSA